MCETHFGDLFMPSLNALTRLYSSFARHGVKLYNKLPNNVKNVYIKAA